MISTTNAMRTAAACAYPAGTAAPKTAVVAATRLRAQETSALRWSVGGSAHVPATGLANADLPFVASNAPAQGPPSRGTPV